MHGGKRPNAGRKPRARNKRSAATVAKIDAADDPLDILLELQSDAMAKYRAATIPDLPKDLEKLTPEERLSVQHERQAAILIKSELGRLAADLATRAAPYKHSKLTSVEAKVDVKTHEAALHDLDD